MQHHPLTSGANKDNMQLQLKHSFYNDRSGIESTAPHLCDPMSMSSCFARSLFSTPSALETLCSIEPTTPASTVCRLSGIEVESNWVLELPMSDLRCEVGEQAAFRLPWPAT